MTAQELLLTLGLPCWPPAADAAGLARALIPAAVKFSKEPECHEAPMDLEGLPESGLEHAAGNAMCIPAVGFAMLVAVLALEPVAKQ